MCDVIRQVVVPLAWIRSRPNAIIKTSMDWAYVFKINHVTWNNNNIVWPDIFDSLHWSSWIIIFRLTQIFVNDVIFNSKALSAISISGVIWIKPVLSSYICSLFFSIRIYSSQWNITFPFFLSYFFFVQKTLHSRHSRYSWKFQKFISVSTEKHAFFYKIGVGCISKKN